MAEQQPDNPQDVIELRVETTSQLFNTLDPYPFRERDLDKDAEDYIVGWARELRRDGPLRIVVHVPAHEATAAGEETVRAGLSRFFEYRAKIVTRELKELFRIGRRSLAVGACIMALALATASFLPEISESSPVNRFMNESLVIMAWVANWRPIEIFLHDWWPFVRRRNLYRRLASADVRLRSAAE